MDICSCAFVCGPCRARRWDIFKYRRCFVQSQFSKNDLEAKQSWIYAVLLLSVGPVGPGGGIYSIIDYVLCKVYFLMDQVDHVICWPSENLTNDILTKWEVEQLGTWPRTSWPHPWDIYPQAKGAHPCAALRSRVGAKGCWRHFFKNPTTQLRVDWVLTEKKCEQTPKFACFSVWRRPLHLSHIMPSWN